MSDNKILVIDNEARMVDSLKTLLSLEGYDVTGEYDAAKAIELIEKSDFDLIITDIKMPQYDGIAVLKKAHEKDPLMGVILITGYASLESAKHAIEQGAFGYLTKPLELDELKLVVSQSIMKRKVEIERLKLLNELKVANESLELKLAQIDALSSAGNLLATTTDLKEALTSILSLAIDVIGAKLGSVMILDPEKEELFVAASCGLDDVVVQNARQKLGSSISGYVAQSGRPLIIEDIEQDPRFARINRQKYESKSLISVPLIYKDELYGVINLNNKQNGKPFTQDDIMMLASLAIPAAVAIDRANLIANKTETIQHLEILHNLAEKVSMMDDLSTIGDVTFDGLQRLLGIECLFWYDYHERSVSLNLDFYSSIFSLPTVPDFIRVISLPEEEAAIENRNMGASIECKIANQFDSLEYLDRGKFQVIPIPIYLRRSLTNVAVLIFRDDAKFNSSMREMAQLALSQIAAIYQRQKAVLNSTRLLTMGKLLAEIGHDLKKPLTNLKGMFQIYKDKFPGKKAVEFFGEAEKEVGRMAELVKEMVEFANPNMYQTKKTDVTRLIERTLELLSSDLKHKDINVIREFEEALPEIMLNDREMLQVFINIILNAVDSMDSNGTLRLKAFRALGSDGNKLKIEISDTGCGIPEEDLSRIFARYYTTKSTGTGLGLSIVERIISVHEGKIGVQSEVGKGTVFIIELPL